MGRCVVESFKSEDSLDGSTPPYMVTATIEWDKVEDFKDALFKGGEASSKDVVNYTDVQPVLWIGKITHSSG